jgi:hypothetical protein
MKRALLILSLFSIIPLFGQHEMTLYNMNFVPQRLSLNPANIPTARYHLGFSAGAMFNTPFSYSDIITRDADDSLNVDLNIFLNSLKKSNTIRASGIGDFSFGFKINPKLYIHAAVAEKVNMRFSFPKAFMDFIINGNGTPEFIGNTVNIGDFRLNAMHYRDYSIGAAYQVNCNLSVGGRVKYLYGMENINTVKSELSIYTNPEHYQLTISNDLEVRTSGLDSNAEMGAGRYRTGLKNRGMGLDLGATITMMDQKLMLSASILDLGYIKWKENPIIYYNDAENKSFTYSGFNESFFSDTNFLQNLGDTILSTFDLAERNEAYTTALPLRIFMSGRYKLMKGNYAGGTAYFEFVNGKAQTVWTAFASTQFGRFVELQGNVSLLNRSISNIGVGLALNLWPLQVWATTDNLIIPSRLTKTRTVHARAGVNFVFGYVKDKKNPCSPTYMGQVETKEVVKSDKQKTKKTKTHKPKKSRKNRTSADPF